MIGSLVVGTLDGPEGAVPVAALSVHFGQLTLDNQFLLMPIAQLTAVELAVHQDVARLASGLRVLDVGSFTSYAFDEVAYAGTLRPVEGDSSLLLGSSILKKPSPEAAFLPPAVPGAALNCIDLAYKSFQIEYASAQAMLAVALSAAFAAFAIAVVACGLIAVAASFLAGPAFATCMLRAAAVLAFALSVAQINLLIKLKALQDLWKLRLAACGVLIVHQ